MKLILYTHIRTHATNNGGRYEREKKKKAKYSGLFPQNEHHIKVGAKNWDQKSQGKGVIK